MRTQNSHTKTSPDMAIPYSTQNTVYVRIYFNPHLHYTFINIFIRLVDLPCIYIHQAYAFMFIETAILSSTCSESELIKKKEDKHTKI